MTEHWTGKWGGESMLLIANSPGAPGMGITPPVEGFKLREPGREQ